MEISRRGAQMQQQRAGFLIASHYALIMQDSSRLRREFAEVSLRVRRRSAEVPLKVRTGIAQGSQRARRGVAKKERIRTSGPHAITIPNSGGFISITKSFKWGEG